MNSCEMTGREYFLTKARIHKYRITEIITSPVSDDPIPPPNIAGKETKMN